MSLAIQLPRHACNYNTELRSDLGLGRRRLGVATACVWRRGRTAPDAAGFGECGVGISYISSHLGPVAAPATCSYLCAHTILHCSAGVALPTSAAPRFAYQMPLLFDSLVYP